jgi:HlyD family secretion protein
MKRIGVYVLGVVSLGVTVGALSMRDAHTQPAAESVVRRANADVVPALGRTEAASEEVRVGADIPGKLARVLVDEGDFVRAGQVLAVLDQADDRARAALAEAVVERSEAEWQKLVNGAREEERKEARAALEEAAAVLSNARVEAQRRSELYEKGAVSREESDRARQAFEVAVAREEAARQRLALIMAPAREDDKARAQAEIRIARSELEEARARLEKTVIRSPISGVVLHRHFQTGETYAPAPDRPIVTLADLSTMRVRADVDEAEIGRIRVGQYAYITAPAYGEQRFPGRVMRIGQTLGKKNVWANRAAERADVDVLETLIELAPGHGLRPGLRVDVYIVVGSTRE